MTPRRPIAQMARRAKARRWASWIVAHAPYPVTTVGHWRALAGWVVRLTPSDWARLAPVAGVNPPSPETVREIVAVLGDVGLAVVASRQSSEVPLARV